MTKKIRILCVVGARPNFIKIAPLMKEMRKYRQIKPILIHTGQHYDFEMSKIFFKDLKIPKPNYNLGVGSGSHAWQTAKIMEKLEPVILKEKPDFVIVVGDVNSTLAGALVAAKLHIKIAHIEAGPRTYDKNIPEEINRILIDHISDFLFCPTKISLENLKKEGIREGIYNSGDIMYDIFLKGIKVAKKKSQVLKKLQLKPKRYFLVTLHRAENTDDRKRLTEIVNTFCEIPKLILPCHPRTEKYLKKYGLWGKLKKKVKLIKPVGYIDMIWLQKNAKKIITDSGGVQKEAYWSKVPCVTLMKTTGWVETVQDGWNILVGTDEQEIIKAIKYFKPQNPLRKYFGDGKTAKRIVKTLVNIKNFKIL